jgi:hypothetical protein
MIDDKMDAEFCRQIDVECKNPYTQNNIDYVISKQIPGFSDNIEARKIKHNQGLHHGDNLIDAGLELSKASIEPEEQLFDPKIYQSIYQTISKEKDIFISQNNKSFVLKYFVYKLLPFFWKNDFEEINLKIHGENTICRLPSHSEQIRSQLVDGPLFSKSGCKESNTHTNCECRRYLKKLLKKMYFYQMLDEQIVNLSIIILKSFLKRYDINYPSVDTFIILLVISLNISNKYLNDEPCNNRSYADLINLDIKIFNRLEYVFLSTLDYTIEHIPLLSYE